MLTYLKRIDILDQPADALIYSCNVQLNCSGGVGAALMMHYGEHVQQGLHEILGKQSRKFAQRGEWFQWLAPGMPYRAVFHTVPCDGWYETTPEIVAQVLRECLAECHSMGNIRTIACAALGTGYGHLPFAEFFRIVHRVTSAFDDHSTIADSSPKSIYSRSGPLHLHLCVPDESRYRDAAQLIGQERLAIRLSTGAEA